MKLPIVVAATVFTLFSAVTSVRAQDQQPPAEEKHYDRIGPYISAGAAWDWRNTAAGGSTAGVNARLGFRFWKYLAAEFEYELQGHGPRAHTFGGNMKFFPMHGAIQPFALMGGSYWDSDSDHENGGGLRLGAGLDSYLTEHVYLTAGIEYLWGLGDLDPYNVATAYIGAGFRL